VFSGDMIAGGVRNLIETYTSGARCRQHHAEHAHDELPDQRGEARKRLFTEKVDRKTGWQYICLEKNGRAVFAEIQDFMECTRPAGSRCGSSAGLETIKVTTPAIGPPKRAVRITVRFSRRNRLGRCRGLDASIAV